MSPTKEFKVFSEPNRSVIDEGVSGSMAVNIEPAVYKGQDCLFVTISTGFDRSVPNASQNLCQVSGFVNKDLETLEERRLITSKASDTVVSNGYSSAPEITKNNRSAAIKRKKILRDFQNCRSLTLEDDCGTG